MFWIWTFFGGGSTAWMINMTTPLSIEGKKSMTFLRLSCWSTAGNRKYIICTKCSINFQWKKKKKSPNFPQVFSQINIFCLHLNNQRWNIANTNDCWHNFNKTKNRWCFFRWWTFDLNEQFFLILKKTTYLFLEVSPRS